MFGWWLMGVDGRAEVAWRNCWPPVSSLSSPLLPGVPSLQPRADAAAARLAALAHEAQQQQEALLQLVAAHEAVVRLASAKLARWELATSGGVASP